MTTNQSVDGLKRKTEIIAFSSGKGGTGKTLIATCLSYALTKIGLKVLVIDSDTATDGISLYLLGPEGVEEVPKIRSSSTLNGIMYQYLQQGDIQFQPLEIHRERADDHGVTYQAIISAKQLYGDRFDSFGNDSSIQLDKESYRKVIQKIFATLREQGEYDYVIVDTRGGFSNESTDVSALADSYIVVTEADVTSFYQNRNLIRYIDQAANDFNKKAVLRAIIVNKSTQFTAATNDFDLDSLESSFRLQLEREFPISYKATHPFPLSFEALTVQKSHRIPIRHALDSDFSYAFLVAFQKILSVVTQPWTKEQVAEWNYLVESVNLAIQKRNNEIQKTELAEQAQLTELEKLRKDNSEYENRIQALNRELAEVHERYKRELVRTDVLAAKISSEKALPAEAESKSVTKSRRSLAPGLIGIFIVGLIITAGLFRSSLFSSIGTSTAPTPTASIEVATEAALPAVIPTDTVQAGEPTQTPVPDTAIPASTITITTTPDLCSPLTATPDRLDNAILITDLTYPKNSSVLPGQSFEKKWLIQNSGSNTWTTNYVVAFGQFDRMKADSPIHFTKDVPTGECLEISILMTAPDTAGTHRSLWVLQTFDNGTRFGFGPENLGGLEVIIFVPSVPTAIVSTP